MNSEKVRKIVKEMWYETFLDKVTIDIDESRASAERDMLFKLQDLGMVMKTPLAWENNLPKFDDLHALRKDVNGLVGLLEERITKLEEKVIKLESGKKN